MSTNFILALTLSAVVSYLLGSCNSAIIVVKLWKKVDVRDFGSKNAGLTNTLRCFGKGAALVTLLGDLAKGVVAVLLSKLIFVLLDTGISDVLGSEILKSEITGVNNLRFIGYIAGFLAILGHIFPLYYGFKGGKGILVSASILIVTDPLTFCIVIPFFALILALTKYVSVSSITAAIAYPIITFTTQYFISDVPKSLALLHTILVIGTSILLIYMHKSNIVRLKNHTENKFSFKKKEG